MLWTPCSVRMAGRRGRGGGGSACLWPSFSGVSGTGLAPQESGMERTLARPSDYCYGYGEVEAQPLALGTPG